MPLNPAMWSMTAAETLLWAVLAFLFWKKGLRRRFPATGNYLALRAIATPILLLFLYERYHAASHALYVFFARAYGFGFMGIYFVAVVLMFFICAEIFRSALAPFPGIARLAILVFCWAAAVSVILTLASISFAPISWHILPDILYSTEHSVSILLLCVLAFLCLSLSALRLNARDLAFGIALGFGVMSSSDLIVASWGPRIVSLNDPVEFVYEALILLSLAIWTTYSILPEPARKPILVPANSTIYRWNEIASALGHTGTRVVVQQPANGFFLSDVEHVVEKVLARNMKGRESET